MFPFVVFLENEIKAVFNPLLIFYHLMTCDVNVRDIFLEAKTITITKTHFYNYSTLLTVDIFLWQEIVCLFTVIRTWW